MTRQRILLSLVCALALVLIPVSYSSLWAQSTAPSTGQQDRTDRNDLNQNQNQNQTNQDLNQKDQSSPDVNSQKGIREKPSSTENNSSAVQHQNRTSNSKTQSSTDSQATKGSQNTDQDASNKNLPNTAGELPLLALIGLLSLGAAAGTRVLRHVRSNR